MGLYWAWAIFVIAMVLATLIGSESRRFGVLFALLGPFIVVVVSCLTVGAPSGSGWGWGPGIVGDAIVGFIFFLLVPVPLMPILMIVVAITIVFRGGRGEPDDREGDDEVDLAKRWGTRADD